MSADFENAKPLITVDQFRLEKEVSEYLRSPRAKAMLAQHEISFLLAIFVCFVTLVAGIIIVLTIKWARTGFGFIVAALTLQPIRQRKSRYRKHPELLKPIICHGVISSENIGLVLGTFDNSDVWNQHKLGKTAKKLGQIYSTGPTQPAEKEVFELLRDDAYRPMRRRTLPQPFDSDPPMVLFDVRLIVTNGTGSPYDTPLYAFVATDADGDDDDETIMQIPWDVVSPSIQFNQ